MPRVVDHDARRRELARALVAVARRDGLHAVTMRAVAAQAGVSLGQVQHYVENKAELVRRSLELLEGDSHARWAARLAGLPDPPPPRVLLEAFVGEALPDDEDSRTFHQLFLAAAVLGLTDADMAAQQVMAGPDRLEAQLVDAIDRAVREGQVTARHDPAVAGAALVTLTHGLGTSVLLGQRSADDARAVLRYHIDLLFTC